MAASPWRIGLAVGYGERSNPLIQSEAIPIALDVDIAWFGKRAFFDNGDLGYLLHDGPRTTLSAVARLNSDRVFFGKANTRFVRIGGNNTGAGATPQPPIPVPPPDRDYAIEIGVELLSDGPWGRAAATAFSDASGTHDGFELAARYDFRWHRGRWVLEPGLSAAYKSKRLNDYYWGVRLSESSAGLPTYSAGASLSGAAHLRTSYYLSKRLRAAASASYEVLPSAVSRSPLVDEDHVVSYFVGLAWRFGTR